MKTSFEYIIENCKTIGDVKRLTEEYKNHRQENKLDSSETSFFHNSLAI